MFRRVGRCQDARCRACCQPHVHNEHMWWILLQAYICMPSACGMFEHRSVGVRRVGLPVRRGQAEQQVRQAEQRRKHTSREAPLKNASLLQVLLRQLER